MFGKLKRYLKDPYFALGCDMIKKHPHWMSDRLYLYTQFTLLEGYKPNLKHPHTLNEKLLWLKLHDHNPLYTKMADKYEMKSIIAQVCGEEHIIPTLGIYNSVDEIDWDKLPNAFVLKCTHDSGSFTFVRDKSAMDVERIKEKMNGHLQRNFFLAAREWSYKYIKPRIIAEPILSNADGSPLIDYKFYCYGGEMMYWMYSVGETEHSGKNLKFDRNGKCIDHLFKKKPKMPLSDVKLPKNLDEMIVFAERLGKNFPHLRVDMYNVNGHIYVGEFTFYSNGGYINIENCEYSNLLADKIDITKVK